MDFIIISLRRANGVRGIIDGNRAGEPNEPGAAMGNTRVEGMENAIRPRHSGDVWLGGEIVFWGEGMAGYRGDSCRAIERHFADCLVSEWGWRD